ncbi:MAG: DUF11 domain-containing protein [Vicinamibacteria bacterium]|nr:DUF11 domain-containing protein [Vicinamibacteria bacterium]
MQIDQARRIPRGTSAASAGRRAVRVFAFGALLFSLAFVTAYAGTPAGYAEYIVPFDEDIFAYVTDPVATGTIGANNTTFTLISVTAWSNTVTVYIDHWENGYGYDENNPDGPGTDEKYTLNTSQTLNFNSLAVPRPRTGADGNTYIGAAGNCNAQPTPAAPLIQNTLNFCYDGRDRIITIGGATTVTRGGYFNAPGPGKLAAIGEEVFPLAPQLIKYRLPFGEDPARPDYQRVMALVQATEDNTTIQIDFQGDGVFDSFNTENGYRTARVNPTDATTLTLQRGEAYVLDRDSQTVGGTLNRGTVILGTKTLQVEYFYGQDGSNYNTRAVSAYPDGFWGKDYYLSADGAAAADTDALIYNPNASAITITWETAVGSGTFNLGANTTGFFQALNGGTYIPNGSGLYLHGTAPFWGTSDVDTNATAWDWGYSMVPDYLASDDQTVAWAPGNDPLLACNAANGRGNGLFLTPLLDNTTFFIDADGDGTPDTNASIEVLRGTTPVAATGQGYNVNRLDSLYITGSNVGTLATSLCDLTGGRVFATGPFTMSYGENPDKASPAGGLDLGYTVLPSPGNWMDLVLTVDKATSPVLVSTVAGVTTVTYTLVVKSHEFDVNTLNVVDTLAADWTYDNDSTTITFPNLTTLSGAAANPTVGLPTLTWPTGLLGSMLPNQEIIITFSARTTANFANGDLTQNRVLATGTRTVGGVTQTFNTTDFVFNYYTDSTIDMQMTKTSSVPLPTPVSPGDPITYTITVTNPPTATTTLTGVTVFDPLPPGVTYGPGVGSVTCEVLGGNVLDQFNSNGSYSGNNGSVNWKMDWAETDPVPGGGGAGFVLVTGNALQLRYQTRNVLDDFNPSNSFTGNDGSYNWASNWNEDNDDDNANGGAIQTDNQRIEFKDTTVGGNDATAEAIKRSATVTNASFITISSTWTDSGVDGGEGVLLQYGTAINGPWTTLRTFDGAATGNGTYTDTIAWIPTDTTSWVRYRALGNYEAGELAFIDNVDVRVANAVGSSAQRTVNLAGRTNPLLTFTTSSANLEASDTLVVEASASPSGPFTTLATYTGGATTGVQPYNLGAYASYETTIRFSVAGNYDVTNEAFNVDNVNIAWGTATKVFPTLAPPELVASDTGCQIRPNNSMTVTFPVTLDDPFPTGQKEILNTATTGVNELPIPLMASATNIVLVPGGITATVGDRVWLDANANGVFDTGETGISGVQVTLKDQFGTPLQITTTDAQGRYTFLDVPPGTGYFVEITGGLPSGLTQTTDTFSDAFDTDGVFTGNNGTLNWLTNWTETNDDNSATTGNLQIVNNHLEIGAAGAEATKSLQRSATVTGVTSIELQYAWATVGGLGNDDDTVVEYSTDGVGWTVLQRLDAGTEGGPGAYSHTIPWTPTNDTFFVRFRAEDDFEAGEQGIIDNVQVRAVHSLRTATFSLVAGQNYLQADLGFQATPGFAAIGDLVWVDANNDQTRNPGEAGLAGITVQLFADTNADGVPDGAPIATQVTGPGGAYLFTGVTTNGVLDYVVTMDTGQAGLTGYTATTNTLFYYPNLPSGAVRVDADFGFRETIVGTKTFSIKDGIWLDNGLPTGTTNNGIKDGTEVGIAGVTVSLLDSAGNTVTSTTTASDGTFEFTGVPGGQNYRWRITDDAGILNNYYGTTPSALSANFQMTGNLTANLDFTSPSDVRHFGYNQTRSIGDMVFNDNGGGGGTLGNGIQDGTEPGIAGVTVLLYRDVNGNSLFEPGGADGAVFAMQVTDASGHYLFAGLPSGSQWWVSIDNGQSALSGYTILTTADNSGVAGHQRLVTPVLSGSNNRLDIDYGYRAATPFTVSGRFFSDANRNGNDDTEAGFLNVSVELLNASGVLVATTLSAADGSYSFIGLPAGTYTVRATDVNAVLAGAETTREKTEGALNAPFNSQETVVVAANVTDVNFGYYRGNALVTRVVISSFVARDVRGALSIEWTTASEIGTVGFYLKRWDDRKNRYVSVNERLIPSLITSTQGGVYRYLDPDVSPGQAYRYLMVEVEASGKRLRYGPFDVDTRVTPADESDSEDGEVGDAAGRRWTADSLLLEKGVSRTPRREKARTHRDRRNRSHEEQSRAARRRRSSNAAKIGIAEDGLYFVTLNDLQTLAGMSPSSNWSRTYALTNHGEPVALIPSAQGDGFWFYGHATRSDVEQDNVYRLSETPAGARMGSRRNPRGANPSGANPSGGEVFVKTLHVEQDLIGANNIYHDPDGDFYVWDWVFAGYGAKSFTFRADGAAQGGGASLTIRLKGGTETETNPDHHATFNLNGSQIGEAIWDGTNELVTTVDFDGSLLEDGENILTIDGLTDTGAEYSLFYVDSFDVTYTSRYRAHGNKAEVSAAFNSAVLISGFTRPDITLFDVTNKNHPVFVQAPVVQTADGTYGVVAASLDPKAVYYALAPDGLAPVARILPDTPSALRQPGNEAEYVVITTEALKETAQGLADYRSDLSSMVVDIEDIYDEFNFGSPSPHAVKAFLTYARTKWRTAPRYVVLAGDGSYDYKNVEGFGSNLIPPMMANTPDGLFPADAWFVERTGTSSTEIAIGRLPVATTAELAEAIRKIEARETALALDEPWLRDTLLVAGETDGGGNFLQSSETVAGVIPAGSSLLRASIPVDGAYQTRLSLIEGINQGTGLVNYFGHGGFDQLANEAILATADAPALINRERPSMMFALTCLVGNSSLPGYSTLGEELVRQESGGLVALFAPSGMSENELATPLAIGLHEALARKKTLRIGDAISAARRAYKAQDLPLYMLSIYNLLGDPAMRVR